MAASAIEWTDMTWNPIAGCSNVSEGCRHCYARGMAHRLAGMERGAAAAYPAREPRVKYQGLTVLQGSKVVWTGRINFDEAALLEPLGRRTPTRYFVNSMSDLFHEGVTDEQLDRIFAVMALCPQHTFQVLTKRPERMRAYQSAIYTEKRGIQIADAAATFFKGMSMRDRTLSAAEHAQLGGKFEWGGPLPNVWLGVSVEDQKAADERIPLLLQTPAAVRFLSCEPLIGPVDLTRHPLHTPGDEACADCGSEEAFQDWLSPHIYCAGPKEGECYACGEALANPPIDWVIVGGESGAGARPMHPDWARSLRDQCTAAGVPFFFKQGAKANWPDYKNFDSFPPELQVREFPEVKRA